MNKLIHELIETEYENAKPVFSNLSDYQAWLLSTLEGNTPGRIFVDDKDNPTAGFCYLGSILFFFAGSSKNTEFNSSLKKILANDIFPNYQAKYSYFMIFYDSGWDEALKEIFGELTTGEGVYYEIKSNERKEWKSTLSSEFTIEQVDREFIESMAYTIPEDINIKLWLVNEWGSLEKFYERGIAYSIVYKKKLVVSFCHCSGFSNNIRRSEIAICTNVDFQRQGLGKNLVFHMLNHFWETGIKIAGWHTTNDNIASRKLAESIGYKFNRTYPIYFGSWA